MCTDATPGNVFALQENKNEFHKICFLEKYASWLMTKPVSIPHSQTLTEEENNEQAQQHVHRNSIPVVEIPGQTSKEKKLFQRL